MLFIVMMRGDDKTNRVPVPGERPTRAVVAYQRYLAMYLV